jgi:hypothetical protein
MYDDKRDNDCEMATQAPSIHTDTFSHHSVFLSSSHDAWELQKIQILDKDQIDAPAGNPQTLELVGPLLADDDGDV